ncbi:MAG: alpha/beta fold hydrolase [Oxalobacteraceae bacterium]|nr:MAG: alpha/beta fold hydrolase [Oxalobacteraceae bacterium]
MESLLTSDQRLTSRLLVCGRPAAPLLLCIHGGGCNSGYFDMQGFSVAQRALADGFDVLLVDRPGYGVSAPPRTANPINEAAELLPGYLNPIMAARASRDLVVIGHSIGGAVALTLAAEARLPINAVAVSGIGREPSEAARAWLSAQVNVTGTNPEPPSEFFFGPEGSYDWRGPMALRKVIEPWRADELRDVRLDWPPRFDAIAKAIAVPVAFHLAEYECIWRAGAQDVADAAARFINASRVEAGVLPDGGHLYEIHRRGAELVTRQLSFLKTFVCIAKPS